LTIECKKEEKMKRVLTVVSLVVVVMFLGTQVFAGGQGESAKKKELSMAAVLYGQANEGTWEPAAYTAIQKVQKAIPFTLNLAESTSTQDAEKVIRNWASRGVSIVFAHSNIYMDQVLTVAKQFKNVHFICEVMFNPDSPDNPNDPEFQKLASKNTPANLTVLGDTPYEGNFLAGYVAGLVTKSKKIGILQPFESVGLNLYSNCFYYGVKAANPNVEMKIVYLGDYVAPAETRDAVKSFAQQGCDIVFSELDDNSAILECAAQGIYCIPMYMDKSSVDPKAVLTTVVFDWSDLLQGSVEAVAKGTMAAYRSKNYFRGLTVKDDSIRLGTFAPSVSGEVKAAVEKIKNQLKDGSLTFQLNSNVIIK
jgi:basic membrane protein A